MGWSYEQLQATPVPVREELERWMREQHAEAVRERKRAAAASGR